MIQALGRSPGVQSPAFIYNAITNNSSNGCCMKQALVLQLILTVHDTGWKTGVTVIWDILPNSVLTQMSKILFVHKILIVHQIFVKSGINHCCLMKCIVQLLKRIYVWKFTFAYMWFGLINDWVAFRQMSCAMSQNIYAHFCCVLCIWLVSGLFVRYSYAFSQCCTNGTVGMTYVHWYDGHGYSICCKLHNCMDNS